MLSLNGHTDNVWGVRWSPDGKQLASSAYDGTLKIWDGVNGDKRKTFLGHSSFHYVSGVTWSPDGAHIAAGGWDRTVRVWNTASGNELLVLRGHTGGVWDLDWSPDGSRLASREQDGQTIKLWDAITGQEILTLTSRGEGNLRWSADGRRLHSGTTTFDAVRGFELSGGPTVASAAAWRHFDRAWELALSGRFNEGRNSYQKALKYNPLLASSEGELKDYESTARFRYGGLLASNGELEAAADAFRSALAFNPKDSAAHFRLGNVLTESRRFSSAIDSFGRAIELEPMFSGAYNGMGMALAGNGEFEASFVALSKAIELNPARAKFRNDLSWLLATCVDLRFRNPARAIEVAEKAVELNPKVAIVWNTLGVSHYRNGNYQAAADALQKSLELSQDGTGFTTRFDGFFLAMAYLRLGDHQRARDFYIKADTWMQLHKPDDKELQRFREEANELLGKEALDESNPGKP